MLNFKVNTLTSFTMADYDTHVIENLLLSLPKATYKAITDSDGYTITREHAMRIMRVTHIIPQTPKGDSMTQCPFQPPDRS